MEEQKPVNMRAPAWRFHAELGKRLAKTDEELDKLDAEGWKDHPGKVKLLPGHEKIWEEEQASTAGESSKEEVKAPESKDEEEEIDWSKVIPSSDKKG